MTLTVEDFRALETELFKATGVKFYCDESLVKSDSTCVLLNFRGTEDQCRTIKFDALLMTAGRNAQVYVNAVNAEKSLQKIISMDELSYDRWITFNDGKLSFLFRIDEKNGDIIDGKYAKMYSLKFRINN